MGWPSPPSMMSCLNSTKIVWASGRSGEDIAGIIEFIVQIPICNPSQVVRLALALAC